MPPPLDDQPPTDRTRWLAPASAAAAIALGRALQISSGTLSSGALLLVGVALVLLTGAVAVGRPLRWAALDRPLVPVLAAVGVIAQVAQLYLKSPGWFVVPDPVFTAPFNTALVVFAVVGAGLAFRPARPVTALLMAALLTTHVVVGASIIRHSPHPPIDVDVFQRTSALALIDGANPYALTFPNIYPHAQFYGPGVSVDGRLQFGFPYLPLSLLVSLPATVLAGDHRYAALFAMELAAILMAYARPQGFGALAAVLYLTTPRVFYVLEMSWTEPLVVLGLAAVVYAACRRRQSVPWLFGGFIALKQYLVFAIPAALLLVTAPTDRRASIRFLAKAGGVAAAITLPFVLWEPGAFVNSVVTLQFRQPFRPDALSFLSWWASLGHPPPSSAIAFLVAPAAAALALWRLPRTAAGFAAAVALTFLAFFAFNKQAFCNYYLFVIGALCIMMAACEFEAPDQDRPWREPAESRPGVPANARG
ncbi:MAG TPA: hypothetical protein VM032_18955 [Vicinamibacterales bacterium]|nr:hypothetical protein [Vicinamibacterales bacterium]